MEVPGPGAYDGFTTFYKVKKNYGVTVFGKQRRIEELQEIKKSKYIYDNDDLKIYLDQVLIEFKVISDFMIQEIHLELMPVLCRKDLKCNLLENNETGLLTTAMYLNSLTLFSFNANLF